tara:strand:- start:80 stop:769 length:690 start_codon:yes stop_codon:yes gene_type:complete
MAYKIPNKKIQQYAFYSQNYDGLEVLQHYSDTVIRRPYQFAKFVGDETVFEKAVDYAYSFNCLLLIHNIEALKFKVNSLHYLRNAKVKFISPGCEITKNSLHVLINFAELYFDTLSFNTTKQLNEVKKELKAKGKYTTKEGKVITKLGSPDIISVQKKAAVVHSLKAKAWLGNKGTAIQELRKAGWSYQKIATHLNNLQVPTRKGYAWTKSTVHKIVKRGRNDNEQKCE